MLSFINCPATPQTYTNRHTLSLHCALPSCSRAPMIFSAFTRGTRLHFTQCLQWLQLLQKSLVSVIVHAKLLDSKELSLPEQIGMTRHIVAGVLLGGIREVSR